MKILKIKNSAFTLAEVLITLTIIGIVAALTIPALLNSTNDAELKTAWKKDYAIISQAFMMLKNENELPYSDTISFISKLSKYLSYSKFCHQAQSSGCWHADNNWSTLAGIKITQQVEEGGLILNNGAYIGTWAYVGGRCTPPFTKTGTYCPILYVDVNGKKPPNVVAKDIFAIDVHGDKIVPMGSPDSTNQYCDPTDTSAFALDESEGCSAQALYQ